jgi:hypothetical protein
MTLWALGAAVAVGAEARAATFTVGSDGYCTHARLADAIAAARANGPGLDVIRIARNHADPAAATYRIVDHAVQVRGGYDACNATVASGTTRIVNRGRGRLFDVSGAAVATFHDLDLDGNGYAYASGSALAVSDVAVVALLGSRLHHFRATDGGAIAVSATRAEAAPRVSLHDVLLDENAAQGRGGAVVCRGAATIVAYGDARLERNAARDGGAVALDGCTWRQYGAVVASNTAVDGGALYAAGGARVTLARGTRAGRTAPAEIAGNVAAGRGAGLFLTDPATRLDGYGVQLRANSSDGLGEGVALMVRRGALATLRRDAACPRGAACSGITGNRASTPNLFASIVAADSGATLHIAETELRDNRVLDEGARSGAIVDAGIANTPSVVVLSNTVLSGNRARRLLSAGRSVEADATYEGHAQVQATTTRANDVEAWIGNAVDSLPVVLTLEASIVGDNVPFASNLVVADSLIDCVVSRVPLPAGATRSLVADPRLATTGVPAPGSPAIDYCDAARAPAGETDVWGSTRPLNDIHVFDRYGPLDVGAFETAPAALVLDPG